MQPVSDLGQLSLLSVLNFWVGKSSSLPACLAGVKAGCVYLCQVAGNTDGRLSRSAAVRLEHQTGRRIRRIGLCMHLDVLVQKEFSMHP